MRKVFFYPFLFYVNFILMNVNIHSQNLNSNLEIMRPFIEKTWIGKLTSPDGTQETTVIRLYELIFNGNAIKFTKTNKELNNSTEGYFYWNDIEKRVEFFLIGSSGVYMEGFVSADGNVITLEGKMTWPEQTNKNVKQRYDFKNTFEFIDESTMIDSWFMNAFGPWKPGHTIKFTAN